MRYDGRMFLAVTALMIVVAITLNEVILYAVWGGNGPGWFYGVCLVDGIALGIAGPRMILRD